MRARETSLSGPNNAFESIEEHKSIEGVLDHLDKTKFTVPESWSERDYKQVGLLFDLSRALSG